MMRGDGGVWQPMETLKALLRRFRLRWPFTARIKSPPCSIGQPAQTHTMRFVRSNYFVPIPAFFLFFPLFLSLLFVCLCRVLVWRALQLQLSLFSLQFDRIDSKGEKSRDPTTHEERRDTSGSTHSVGALDWSHTRRRHQSNSLSRFDPIRFDPQATEAGQCRAGQSPIETTNHTHTHYSTHIAPSARDRCRPSILPPSLRVPRYSRRYRVWMWLWPLSPSPPLIRQRQRTLPDQPYPPSAQRR